MTLIVIVMSQSLVRFGADFHQAPTPAPARVPASQSLVRFGADFHLPFMQWVTFEELMSQSLVRFGADFHRQPAVSTPRRGLSRNPS